MEETSLNLIIGAIILILIINSTMLFSLTPVIHVPDPTPVAYVPDPALVTTPLVQALAPVPQAANPIQPLLAPVINSAAVVSADAPLRVSQPSPSGYYVTIEPPEPVEKSKNLFLQPEIPRRSSNNFITIFSLTNQTLYDTLPRVSFNLVNPPLIIDYNVTPYKYSDTKLIEYKIKNKEFTDPIVVRRPYEGTWVKVVVKDKETGNVVTEDGFGNIYSYQSPKQIVLYEPGNYIFEFTGEYATINLTMKVKTEGNIPLM